MNILCKLHFPVEIYISSTIIGREAYQYADMGSIPCSLRLPGRSKSFDHHRHITSDLLFSNFGAGTCNNHSSIIKQNDTTK